MIKSKCFSIITCIIYPDIVYVTVWIYLVPLWNLDSLSTKISDSTSNTCIKNKHKLNTL